jgi:hypothetical protein
VMVVVADARCTRGTRMQRSEAIYAR